MHLKARGLHGVEFIVSDDHAGLKKALTEVLTDAAWQRCDVNFLRNALDYLPWKADDDCLQELRWLYDRRDLTEDKRDLAVWLAEWSAQYPQVYGLGRGAYRRDAHLLPPTPGAPQAPEEIKRRTRVLRIFPNTESCLWLVRPLCVEIHESGLEDNRYLNMDLLEEQWRERLRPAA